MSRHSILIARFPYGGNECSGGTDWLLKTVLKMKQDRRVGEIHYITLDDTPITMTRNKACKAAMELSADLCLMIDNDIVPDWVAAKPWWDSTFEFMLDHKDPCIVAAPYCGPPPHENIYVFRWRKKQSDCPDFEFSLQQYSREEAAFCGGIDEVAAIPTGLCMFHTRMLYTLPTPWFDYEYTDKYCTAKATTEDVYFSREASFHGFKVYCNWDSWAGHVKRKVVGKPTVLTADQVSKEVREARRKGRSSRERMMTLVPGRKVV